MTQTYEAMNGLFLEDLKVGQSAMFGRTVTEADIAAFAGVSGDTNPIHLHDGFARTTRFGQRIAHGMLSGSFISTVIGTKLPGPGCIYLSQNLKFRAPVRSGDTVWARATITSIVPEKKRVVMETTCRVGNQVVLEGEAIVMVPARA